MAQVVQEIRKTIFPKELFDIIEGYLEGDYSGLCIIGLHKTKGVIQHSVGAVPEYIAANDTVFKNGTLGG